MEFEFESESVRVKSTFEFPSFHGRFALIEIRIPDTDTDTVDTGDT